MCLPPLRVVTRLTENVHILSVCADYLQISGYRRGKYGHFTEKDVVKALCRIKLTELCLM